MLIANRGEIACRIMRTASRMGLRTVAVYSDADADAQHVKVADRAIRIGAAPALASYLDIGAVVDAALATGADAIHPGYGFLSENAEFAEACADRGIIFVGPSAEAIRAMGSKIEAKLTVAAAGTPVVPGYQGDEQSDAQLAHHAQAVGFPLLIKASAGGGGKGMRLVNASDDFAAALSGARRESRAAFGDDRMLLERYLQVAKHLEVQILADRTGHTLHLNERDCSMQRRHQKVVEEAPGPTVSDELRERLGVAAVQAAKSVGYLGAGTVEFIAEEDEFFFMEMNTRLQVEHPVTEAITGLDLVEWQLRIAAGEDLDFSQAEVRRQGHAVEVRIYAENPGKRFLPSSGTLAHLEFPDNVRVDSGVVAGDLVSVYYDPMLAKVIAHGPNREATIARLDAALQHTQIAGVEHNVAYLRRVIAHPQFLDGSYTTGLGEQLVDELVAESDSALAICAVIALQRMGVGAEPWERGDGFRLNEPPRYMRRVRQGKQTLDVSVGIDGARVDGVSYSVTEIVCRDAAPGQQIRCVIEGQRIVARVVCRDTDVFVMHGGDTCKFTLDVDDLAGSLSQAGSSGRITSPMPGQVISLSVAKGDRVSAGDVLLVVEAMKMEHVISSPHAGTVSEVNCAVGERIDDETDLIVLEP
ncbi:MAG: biotin carboxylase N-terminal domain-containing protein [Pseudomonadales bacterium]